MELPLFMRMVQAYHLTYAAETLGADKEKRQPSPARPITSSSATSRWRTHFTSLRSAKAKAFPKISNNPLLATNEQLETLADLRTNMKNSAKEYLSDKTGERKAERKDVPAGGLTDTERFPRI